RFVLTFTSGGAANAEMWVRDWAETWAMRVHIMDRTMSLAAINVTGPRARELLQRAGVEDPPKFLGHTHAAVAGVPCHLMRLSFTGEASWELHHPVDRSVELWRALMSLGADLGIRPHGLKALFGLRLEKGHIIIGMDTELDTTPRRVRMPWANRMDKEQFIGKAALERTAKQPDERLLHGFTMDGDAPLEGSPIYVDGAIVGHVSGSWASPVLGKTVMLGWIKHLPYPDRVEIDGREAVVTPTPFYDPEGDRARAQGPGRPGRRDTRGDRCGRLAGCRPGPRRVRAAHPAVRSGRGVRGRRDRCPSRRSRGDHRNGARIHREHDTRRQMSTHRCH